VSAPVTVSTVDSILAVQLTVAWAGESRETTKRLGWWHTDLIDSTGGGDFLARLLPRTHAWASLEAVREAARRADDAARRGMADPDQVRTLYFLGFDLDERLAERLAELKRGGQPPASALPFPVALDAPFTSEKLTEALALGAGRAPAYDVVPGGRHLKGAAPAAPELLVQNLAAALLPLAERYPTPFYRVKP
jgi:AcrR family transcriptional regulator